MSQQGQEAESKVKENANTEDANIEPTFLHKHPLQNQWKLWYIKYDKNKCWEDNMKQIASFDNVRLKNLKHMSWLYFGSYPWNY